MNWIKENKFLSAFLAITLVGAGALTFLMMSAMGRATTADASYQTAASELSRLQNLSPYPDTGNLAQMEKLKKTHKESIEELQSKLAATQLTLNTGTNPAQFQDQLLKTVNRVKAAAAGVSMEVETPNQGQKFYMSFEKYETEPPKPDAAAPLLHLLQGMETVVNLMVANKILKLTEIKHDNLPEEGGKKEPAKDPGKGPAKDKDDPNKGLVVRHPFEITFVARELEFHRFMNSLVTEKSQFFVPKSVAVRNEIEAGPPRASTGGATPPGQEDVPKIIVGEEKLQITMKIEMVDFAQPAAAKGASTANPASTPKGPKPADKGNPDKAADKPDKPADQSEKGEQ